MRKTFSIIMSLLLSTASFSQTQQGYVKTKGRLGANGTVIAGSRLSGATVQVKGGNTVVSDGNGCFTLRLASGNFYLQSVKKNGFVLTDPDVLSRQHICSDNPLMLVLETPKQLEQDWQDANSSVRKSLYTNYLAKDAELRRLVAENKILQEDYNCQKRMLDSLQYSNDKLVEEMARRYSLIDFDQMNEFNRKLSGFILSGQLTQADSMLRTKGNIHTRIEKLEQYVNINRQEAIQLDKRQKQLEKSELYVVNEREDVANDCYSYFEMMKLRQDYDSAAYYIELRASIDTTNVSWQLDAGDFLLEYVMDVDNPESVLYFEPRIYEYYNRALCYAESTCGSDSPITGICYLHLGDIADPAVDLLTKYIECSEDSLVNYSKAKRIFAKHYGDNSIEVAQCLLRMARVYSRQFYFNSRINPYAKEATDCAKRAYEIFRQHYGDCHYETAICLAERGDAEYFYGDAFPHYHKALEILDSLGDGYEAARAEVLEKIARRYDESVEKRYTADMQMEALYGQYIIGKEVGDDGQYLFANFTSKDWENFENWQTTIIELSQARIEDYKKALPNYESALKLFMQVYGDKYPRVVSLKDTIEGVLSQIEHEEKTIVEAQKQLSRIPRNKHR